MKKLKKALILFLTLALCVSLASCSQDTPTPPDGPDTPDTPDTPEDPTPPDDEPEEDPITAPIMKREDFPRLDGSTSTAPLAIAMAALMLGESEEEAASLISFSRTTNSYYNLLNGDADLLIVSEGNQEVYDAMREAGFAYEQTPFAVDAFVFVVNASNPVDSITVDEARRIYTGEITNWSQLGGADQEIIPLQRNPEAGSQSLMEKLVMDGTPMMEPPMEYVAGSMGGLMEAVRGYDASAGAIGYSVYYYAEEMRAAKGLKLLKIDGVAPEPEAIRSGAYPLTNPYYVVIPASAEEGSPTRIIRDWLLGENGQRLAAREGYVSVMDIPTKPRETLPEVGTRLFPEYTPELVPGSYGTLIPYAGLRVSDSEFAVSGCVYGLMTPKGQIVVDPVYADVWMIGDLLVLTRVTDGEKRVAVAAKTGAWCTDFEYLEITGGDNGLILYKQDSISLIRPNGESVETLTAAEMGLTAEELYRMSLGPIEGGGGEWLGDKISVAYVFDDKASVLCFDLTDRKLKTVDGETWGSYYPPDEPETPPIQDAWFIYDSALGKNGPAILGKSEWTEDTYVTNYYYTDGTPIPGITSVGYNPYQSVRLLGGLIEVLDVNTAVYYDMNTLEVVFRTYLGFEGD